MPRIRRPAARRVRRARAVPPLTADERRVARTCPSFRDFVDDALFHPRWGYYSTGQVRFGTGGHYETFPLALSPFFGRMLAQYAFRRWQRCGRPAAFDICEIGAGNGQLCLDTLLWLHARPRPPAAWKQFAAAARYRIIERSPALRRRQRAQLGPLAAHVHWAAIDLGAPRVARLGHHAVVFANEVLDCLAHHKIMPRPDGSAGVVFVVPTEREGGGERRLGRRELAAAMADPRRRERVGFEEVLLPLAAVPEVAGFMRRHYPELLNGGRFRPYFACPAIERVVRNVGRLYRRSEMLWIDYGDRRAFHLGTPASQRVFAGPPRSRASVYRDPGRDDITFFVDFSVVEAAARAARLRVKRYGGQGELARRSGVRLDRNAADEIARWHALTWLLALSGVGPERAWQHTGLTWASTRRRRRLQVDARRAVDEFFGRRPTTFKLMILRTQT